jgi:hypothetical protein
MPILILPFPIAAIRGAFAFHSHYRPGVALLAHDAPDR